MLGLRRSAHRRNAVVGRRRRHAARRGVQHDQIRVRLPRRLQSFLIGREDADVVAAAFERRAQQLARPRIRVYDYNFLAPVNHRFRSSWFPPAPS